MSGIRKNVDVEIEVTDSEKEYLIQAYRIMKNIAAEMWNEDLDDTEEACTAESARDNLRDFLQNYLGVDDYED